MWLPNIGTFIFLWIALLPFEAPCHHTIPSLRTAYELQLLDCLWVSYSYGAPVYMERNVFLLLISLMAIESLEPWKNLGEKGKNFQAYAYKVMQIVFHW